MVTVQAFDGDRGVDDTIRYSIIDGNEEINGTLSFVIGNESGVITVNVPSLDRETHHEYTLTVQVSSKATLGVIHSITVLTVS